MTRTASRQSVQTYLEQEAAFFVEAAKRLEEQSPPARAVVNRYWKRRLDIAHRIDKGEMGREAGIALVAKHEKQALAELQQLDGAEKKSAKPAAPQGKSLKSGNKAPKPK